ncbi:MAG TPA: tripartite tricarboxylate transporter substrate binding protein [Caldimonas sp.]|nr:tripartite tricarboxylate transporter substrate binding protein [Caldimonas sp.]
MRTVSSCVALLGLCAGLTAAAPAALAQAWPSQKITIVVPFSAGGGHDAMARICAEGLATRLGQPVIVENRPGANGMVGADNVVRAAPDGYTVLFSSPAEIVIAPSAYKTMRYDPEKDLIPVTLAATTPLVLVANPSLGVHTLPELIALAKRKPGSLSFGTPGNGSSQQLAGAWLDSLAGIDMQHVPYKGAGPATNDVLAGTIPLAIVGMAPVLPLIKAGKLVAIAVMTPERVPFAPDVPTVAETPGMAGFTASHWMGIFVPAHTPQPIVDQLQAAFAAVLKTPAVRDKLLGMGIVAVGDTPAEFKAFLEADRVRFAKMYKLTGLTPE